MKRKKSNKKLSIEGDRHPIGVLAHRFSKLSFEDKIEAFNTISILMQDAFAKVFKACDEERAVLQEKFDGSFSAEQPIYPINGIINTQNG